MDGDIVLVTSACPDALALWLHRLGPAQILALLTRIWECVGEPCSDDRAVSKVYDTLRQILVAGEPDADKLALARRSGHDDAQSEYEQRHADTCRELDALRVQCARLEAQTEHSDERCDLHSSRLLLRQQQELNAVITGLREELAQERCSREAECLRVEAVLCEQHSEKLSQHARTLNEQASPVVSQLGTLLQDTLVARIRDIDQRVVALQDAIQEPLLRMHEYVTAFSKKESSSKGRALEDKYCVLLRDLLPRCEIEETRYQAHTMDFRIHNPPNASVLIDVKNYQSNVTSKEIKKFHEDMITNGLSGILVSAHTGIATKDHMQIDVLEGRLVAVYLAHVGGDMHHILTALNIIYSLHRHLNDAADDAPRLDRRTLDDITLRLRQLGQGVKELVDMNERQRRLLGQLDVQPIVDALLGRAAVRSRDTSITIDVEEIPKASLQAFCDRHLRRQEPDGFFRLRDAIDLWATTEQGPAPSYTALRHHVEGLGGLYLKRKTVNSQHSHGVITGFVLVDAGHSNPLQVPDNGVHA